MVINKYAKGRKKEYKLKNKLEKEGYIVLRTAGSHGFADLIAISLDEHEIRFIQVKPDYFPESRRKELMEKHEVFNKGMVFEITYEIL